MSDFSQAKKKKPEQKKKDPAQYRAEMVRRMASIIDMNRDRMPSIAPGLPNIAAEWFLGITKGQTMASSLESLKRFLRLPAGGQKLVIDAVAEGIPWHGDEIEQFKDIIRLSGKPIPEKVKKMAELYKD